MSEPHKWYCQEHQTVEPTRYTCVNKVLAAKDERIRTLEAEVARLREEHETDEMVKKALREKNRALEARYQDEYAAHQRTLVVGREEIERLQTAVGRLREELALVSEQRDGLAQGADAIWERGYNAAIEHVRAALEGAVQAWADAAGDEPSTWDDHLIARS